MGIGCPGRLFKLSLVLASGVAETEIVGHGAVEQIGVLRDYGHLLPQFFEQRHVLRRSLPPQPHNPVLRVEEP